MRKGLRGPRFVDEGSLWCQHTFYLFHRRFRPGDVVERAEINDHVERFIGEWNPANITDDQVGLGPGLPQVIGRFDKEFLFDVQADQTAGAA